MYKNKSFCKGFAFSLHWSVKTGKAEARDGHKGLQTTLIFSYTNSKKNL